MWLESVDAMRLACDGQESLRNQVWLRDGHEYSSRLFDPAIDAEIFSAWVRRRVFYKTITIHEQLSHLYKLIYEKELNQTWMGRFTPTLGEQGVKKGVTVSRQVTAARRQRAAIHQQSGAAMGSFTLLESVAPTYLRTSSICEKS